MPDDIESTPARSSAPTGAATDSIVPPEAANKMPWWGYILTALISSGALAGSSYGGSVFGAAQVAAENAVQIEELKKEITKDAIATASREAASQDLVSKVDTMTKTLEKQSVKIERLTLIIATTSNIDINTLIPPSRDNQ